MMLATRYVTEEVKLGKTYVVVKAEGEADEAAFRTILYSRPSFVPPVTVSLVNGEQTFVYDATADGFQKVSELQKSLSPSEFLLFMKNLTEVIIKSADYMLEPLNFLIEEEYIFINTASRAVRLIYLPFCEPAFSEDELSRRLYELAQTLSRRFSTGSDDGKWQQVKACLYDMPSNTTVYDANSQYTALCGVCGAQYESAPQRPMPQPPPMSSTPLPQAQANRPIFAAPVNQQVPLPQAPVNRPMPQPVPPPAQPAPQKEWAFGDDPKAKSAKPPKPPKPAKPPKENKGLFGGLFGGKKNPPVPNGGNPFAAPNAGNQVAPNAGNQAATASLDFDADKTSVFEDGMVGVAVPALYIIEQGQKTMKISINTNPFVLGRSPEVNHRFNAATDRTISRVHAAIGFDGNRYFVTDKRSTGGTFVNGQRLNPETPELLNNGSVIRIGGRELLFEV